MVNGLKTWLLSFNCGWHVIDETATAYSSVSLQYKKKCPMTELTSVRLKSFNNASFQHCVTSQQIRELELSQDCALINSALFKESHKKKFILVPNAVLSRGVGGMLDVVNKNQP